MQLDRRQTDQERMDIKARLTAAEVERDKARQELKEMKRMADEANKKLNRAMSNGKVVDVFTELDSVMDALSKSNQELKLKEKAIESLKAELEKAKGFETKLKELDALFLNLKEELGNARSSEARMISSLSESNRRIEELEAELEKKKESEKQMFHSLSAQTKQLEENKVLLQETKAEADSLRNKADKSSINEHGTAKQEPNSLKTGSLLEEMELVKKELSKATKAEENNKKAMDDLAIALKEVATEASQTREKLILAEDELEKYKREGEQLKETVKNLEEKHKTALDELKKEADLYKNKSDRLRLEAEESLMAWNGKETGFVECIKTAEDEKAAALEENSRLLEMLQEAENLSNKTKQEMQNLRDILKQALNEANVSKEAAAIAQQENSQLKDILAEKDDALMFITRENENLRINEAASQEHIKELKRLLSEESGKEFKTEDKDHEHKSKSQNHTEKEHSRKLSSGFSFNLKDLITHSKHKDTTEEDHKVLEKLTETGEEEESEGGDLFKGSIFDVAESPVAAPPAQHRRKKSLSAFTDFTVAMSTEDYDHANAGHIDELDHERNSRKKKALLRRFGDMILLRRGVHRREPSIGGEAHKKEPSAGESHKKDTSPRSEGHNKKEQSAAVEAHKNEPSAAGEGHKNESPTAGEGYKNESPTSLDSPKKESPKDE